ncbi:unnamed protein product [Phytophthora fragariaefolia]|uniref:Unnamed protein product n=1 Tax=Phytophthora fragariaefolia TaxID=1490495 RepID=A0A9W6U1N4_9STRA|nr:unnamed protein product [Phytophthora fragariaefolia]
MAQDQSPLARADARALRALSADTPSSAASPETSVSVMAPPTASSGADGDSPSRPPLAGVAEASVPSSLPTVSTGDASGEGSESSLARRDAALSPTPGAVPRSAADAPEAASSADSADSQPQGSVSSSGASGDGACAAAGAPETSPVAPGAPPYSSVRWEDIEAIVTAGTVARLDHADAARQLVATNIALEQSSQAAAVVEQLCRRLDKSLADTHKVIRQDREHFKAGISLYATQLRQLREYLERSERQSSVSGGASSASASAMPAAFATFLEELGALQSLGGAAATSGPSTSLTVDSDTSDDSGPIIPSALRKDKGKRPAKSPAKPRSAPSPPKKKQRLGRPSVDWKARKAAKQAASGAASGSGAPPQPPVAPIPTSSAPVSGIAVLANSGVLSLASVPSGSNPPFSPIPRAPVSTASSTASTVSLPSIPGAPSGITPGTEASVPVAIDDDGGSEAVGAASEASDALGGVFSSPAISQPREHRHHRNRSHGPAGKEVYSAPLLGSGPLGGRLEPSATPPHRLPARPAPRGCWVALGRSRCVGSDPSLACSLGVRAYGVAGGRRFTGGAVGRFRSFAPS